MHPAQTINSLAGYSLVSKTSGIVLDNSGSATPGTALTQTSDAVGSTTRAITEVK